VYGGHRPSAVAQVDPKKAELERITFRVPVVLLRDGNLGTGTRYPPGTRPDGYGYVDDFLPAGGTRT
jgi:hypothetical protein